MFNRHKESEQQEEILAYLEALLGCVKSLHASVGAVMADVAAMRSTMLDDPDQVAMYRNNLKLAMATAKPMVEEAMHSYDDLLEELAGSQQYKN
ncbi:MAG TPA: hypothetical protein VJX72_04130 [Candidatus Acidoferrum sp.]|jgi:hypothetical protein|nr:hypothetical protein [Candidatus Acidoferrum sp.]